LLEKQLKIKNILEVLILLIVVVLFYDVLVKADNFPDVLDDDFVAGIFFYQMLNHMLQEVN
jgi:hypothetical protein